jgi:hypothetical protein
VDLNLPEAVIEARRAAWTPRWAPIPSQAAACEGRSLPPAATLFLCIPPPHHTIAPVPVCIRSPLFRSTPTLLPDNRATGTGGRSNVECWPSMRSSLDVRPRALSCHNCCTDPCTVGSHE